MKTRNQRRGTQGTQGTHRTDGGPAPSREVDLIAAKAQRMSLPELSAELARIDRAMAREDTSAKQWRRYQQRRAVMNRALTTHLHQGAPPTN